MARINYRAVLSLTEPNHQIFLRFRQDDTQTQTLSVEITANGKLFPFTGYTVEFVNITRSDSGQPIVEHVDKVYPQEARIEFTLGARSLQWLGKNKAYFSFKDSTGNEVFSTNNFEYEVVHGVHKEPILDSGYLWKVEELIERLTSYALENQLEWEKLINDNKKILESIDPGGKILAILNEAKGDYASLADRLNQKFQVPVGSSQIRETTRFFDYDTMKYVDLVPRNLNTVINSVDNGKFNFSFITDIHVDNHNLRIDGVGYKDAYYLRHWRAIPQFQKLGNKTDVMVYGGDNIDGGNGSLDGAIGIIDEWSARHSMLGTLKRFTNAAVAGQEKPVIICKGNHDACFEAAWRKRKGMLCNADFEEYWNGLYGGVLFPDKNVAIYRFDTCDFYEGGTGDKYTDGYSDTAPGAFSAKQINAFGEWLVNVPRNYHVVLVGHTPLGLSRFPVRNENMISTLIEGFKSGSPVTIDWSKLGQPNDGSFGGSKTFAMNTKGAGVVVGYFCGHWHEQVEGTFGTVKMILCDVGFSQTANQVDTPDELAFYKIEVDTATRKVTSKGVGRARDFTYNY
ncbi:TPA: BppU family phage baseplate upper protein [Enterococcus faecium]|uniref:phage baseplate upper protein n=1 Tax=Enterococcus faecium TaxID=1352 RepID=UPI00032F2D60|nr:phage baseplate upper protein [Enterococcus faecium]EMF0585105.1 BppU family phage baseplate upper protein [Enterococcus faecium]EOH45684.1 hypothetical protein SSI_01724 [Enterococcus faecium EnGen0191]EOM66665.1 hypothetical protein SK9_01865 [Enterococcus faecium EnGen0163]HAQ3640974.1 BppU family phage baseplate upper protein [Enterococcus faecium]HCU0014008.1 BppU family phage baseplate upper protein [Enterococcus faecium]